QSGANHYGSVRFEGGLADIKVNLPYAGYYHIYSRTYNNSSSGANRCEKIHINGREFFIYPSNEQAGEWVDRNPVGKMEWNSDKGSFDFVPHTDAFYLNSESTFKIETNWGYSIIDELIFVPVSAIYFSDFVNVNHDDLTIEIPLGDNDTAQLLENIEALKEGDIKLTDADGLAISPALLGTGMKLKLMIDDIVHHEYNIIIRGDIDGNGELDIIDILMAREAILKGEFILGADIVYKDGTVSDDDVDAMRNIILGIMSSAPLHVDYLTLSPGADEKKLNFSWHTGVPSSAPVVSIQKEGQDAAVFSGTCSSSSSTISQMYYNKVTVDNLDPNATYTYKVGDGNGKWSTEYEIKTRDPDSFSYIMVSDMQLMSQAEADSWKDILDVAYANFPDAAFMGSAGDQVMNNNKIDYDYFFTPKTHLATQPFAVCMGNHDGSGAAAGPFWNPPNSDANINYWYRYGDALFIVYNVMTATESSLRTFLTNAINANLDAKWRILTFHNNVYGQGPYSQTYMKDYRDQYVQVIDDFDIDIAYNGHEHSYSRSYPMRWSGSAATSNEEGIQPEFFSPEGYSVNPTGTTYITLNAIRSTDRRALIEKQPYTAFMLQNDLAMFSVINVTATTYTTTCYEISEDGATITEVDSYTIFKSANG
ncbi:MAG: fibronectin type III domain-containing protein, partial [Parabacteroides sp.]|nr:fibronectin type III domain-containing protein [Parabacteroides sp.]